MNRTKVISFHFSDAVSAACRTGSPQFLEKPEKEASGNKGREPAKETTETNSDTPMPEYLDFDALKHFSPTARLLLSKGSFLST
mgnify:CR=1 FL=1